MIVDWQHHYTPEEIFRKRYGKRGRVGFAVISDGKVGRHLYEESHLLDRHLAFMETAGIDVAVFSTAAESVEECRIIDDHYAEVMQAHPGRIVCLAPCLPTRGDAALKELERAIGRGLRGVVIRTQNEGAYLDSPAMRPFFQAVSNLRVPIFVHISGVPAGYDALRAPYDLNCTMAREFDLAAATARIVLGGVLQAFPDLQFVIAHMGGGISSILERIERHLNTHGDKFWTTLGGVPPFPMPHKEHFRRDFNRLYFDLAGFEGGTAALQCALTTIGPQRLLFGTDYPQTFTYAPQDARAYIDHIRGLELTPEAIAGMLGGNAARLLGIDGTGQ